MNPFEEISNKVGSKVEVTHKGKWSDAPSWAKWLAQSADGTWEWFSTKPKPRNFGLYVAGTFVVSGKGKSETIKSGDGKYYITRPNPNWRKTIEKRPTGAERK